MVVLHKTKFKIGECLCSISLVILNTVCYNSIVRKNKFANGEFGLKGERMNRTLAIIIGVCVGAAMLSIAAQTLHKRSSHGKIMSFRELLQDNECCGTINA